MHVKRVTCNVWLLSHAYCQHEHIFGNLVLLHLAMYTSSLEMCYDAKLKEANNIERLSGGCTCNKFSSGTCDDVIELE